MEKLRAVLIDDAAQARRLLRLMLEQVCSDVEVTGEAATAEEGRLLVHKNNPDVVFLDIEMPGRSGIQLATEWAEEGAPVRVVFTTAYNDYAVTAFRLSAVDYLLKPLREQHLAEAVDKIRREKNSGTQQQALKQLVENLSGEKEKSLTVPVAGGFVFIPLDEILRVEADGSYTRIIRHKQKPLMVAKNLKYFETALCSDPRFLRVHRSFLVNVAHVRSFEAAAKSVAVMTDGVAVDVARERKDKLLERISGL